MPSDTSPNARWAERRRSRDDALLRLGLPAFLGVGNLSVGLLAREVSTTGFVGVHGFLSLALGAALLGLSALRALIEWGWVAGPRRAESRRAYRRGQEASLVLNAALLGVDLAWALALMMARTAPGPAILLGALLVVAAATGLGRVAARAAGWRQEGPVDREVELVFLELSEAEVDLERLPAEATDVLCQYCSCPVTPREAVLCRRCETLHHPDCWEEGQGCTTYACHETRCVDLRAWQSAAPGP